MIVVGGGGNVSCAISLKLEHFQNSFTNFLPVWNPNWGGI